jgi:hypothetical protein
MEEYVQQIVGVEQEVEVEPAVKEAMVLEA